MISHSWIRPLCVFALCLLSLAVSGSAADKPMLTGGFEVLAPAVAPGKELARQPDLWMMEVAYKNIRLIWVDVTDPKTGEKKREQVRYLAWRAINRPLPAKEQDLKFRPMNEPEPLPGAPKFTPKFDLVTYKDEKMQNRDQTYLDEIVPEAMAVIRKTETRSASAPVYGDTLSVIQDLPPIVAPNAEEQPYLYGIAIWRNVNPDARFFEVEMHGFSNGYERVASPDNGEVIMRKVLVQKFLRPGDRYDPNQKEFQFSGEPAWKPYPSPTKVAEK